MEVSNSLSPNARKTELAQLYASLLCDQSRWVSVLYNWSHFSNNSLWWKFFF